MKSSRRIIAFNRVTADGYFAASNGDLSWAVPDDAIERDAVGSMPEADTILFGRRTYEMFESFWPRVVDAPEVPDPHSPARSSPSLRAMARWIDEATKIVFSRTRTEVTWKNSRVIHELSPGEVESLKAREGKDLMIFGSGSITSLLTQHALIDEYHFVVSPLLLGSGQSLLRDVSRSVALRLLEAKSYPSGNVKLRYARG